MDDGSELRFLSKGTSLADMGRAVPDFVRGVEDSGTGGLVFEKEWLCLFVQGHGPTLALPLGGSL